VSVTQKRAERIHLRVSVSEKRKFERLAKRRHTDLSELVRQFLHRESEKPNEAAA
jgi:uncharacterized protein (DUF1778 family)